VHGEQYSPEFIRPKDSGTELQATLLPPIPHEDTIEEQADVAQLVEQLIRNQQVVSSSLTVGSSLQAR
jgi:hypothetical protein